MPAPKPTKLPDWATNATGIAATTEPSAGKKADGWASAEKPRMQFFNWWFNLVGQWADYLNDLFDNAITWTAAHIFQKGITVTNSVNGGHGINATGGPGLGGIGIQGSGGTGADAGVSGIGGAGGGLGVTGQGVGASRGGEFTGGATGGGVLGTGGGGNTVGVEGAGAGTAAGVKGTGGNTGAGVSGTGGAGGARGVIGVGTAAYEGGNFSSSGTGWGMVATAGTNASGAVRAEGNGTGAGVDAVAGATGVGVLATGGATSGAGVRAQRGDSSTSKAAVDCRGALDMSNSTDPAAAVANQLARALIPKAFAQCKTHTPGGSAPYQTAFGISGSQPDVTNAATGRLKFTLDVAMASSDYVVVVTVNSPGGGNHRIAYVDIIDASNFEVTIFDTADAVVDLTLNVVRLHVIVFGKQ